MPRDLAMRHLGIDPTDRATTQPGGLTAAMAALIAQVQHERAAS
jgi:hypothetical protein